MKIAANTNVEPTASPFDTLLAVSEQAWNFNLRETFSDLAFHNLMFPKTPAGFANMISDKTANERKIIENLNFLAANLSATALTIEHFAALYAAQWRFGKSGFVAESQHATPKSFYAAACVKDGVLTVNYSGTKDVGRMHYDDAEYSFVKNMRRRKFSAMHKIFG